MFRIDLRTRLAAAVLACATSSIVLGTLVLAMPPLSASASLPVVALGQVSISASSVN